MTWARSVVWPICSGSVRHRSPAGAGGGIDLANAERVDLLELIVASLLRLYPADAAEQWLQGLNPHLGDRRPIDLVRAGRAQELLGAIAAERSGGFV